MARVGRFWVCPDHGAQRVESQQATVDRSLPPAELVLRRLVGELPFPIALLLSEYVGENDPFVKLHRLTDAAELITRFSAMIVLSDLLKQCGEFPDLVRKALAEKIERPTFGAWKDMLAIACQHLPRKDRRRICFVAELPDYVESRLLAALGSGESDPQQYIIALRNLVAHSGRLSVVQAADLLSSHQEPFETLISELGFVSNYSLIACAADGHQILLRGLAEKGGSFPVYESAQFLSCATPGRVLLVREPDALDLFPLQSFSEVFQRREQKLARVAEAAPQIYFRLSGKGDLEFTPLGDRAAFAQQRGDALQRFREIFRLEEWRQLNKTERKRRELMFDDLRAELGEVFVGRDVHVSQVKAALKSGTAGVLWISGKPGVGKSALMARLVKDYHNAPHYVVIPYFFRTAHAGCSTEQFLKTALLHLHATLGEQPPGMASSREERTRQFVAAVGRVSERLNKKVLLLVDGLDEIHRKETTFVPLLFTTVDSEAIWICAGRSEPPDLEMVLRQCGAARVFPDGLPTMDEPSMRILLTECLERLKYQLFERDQHTDGHWHNRFTEVLLRKSEGLPLYVKMATEDLRGGKWTLAEEDKLPDGLKAYFEQILEQLRVSDVGSVLTPLFCLLAWGKEPVTEPTLKTLLSGHYLSKSSRWDQLFRQAMEQGHLMLRRAVTTEGTPGWIFYHDSFRQYLHESNTVCDNRQWAEESWLEYCQRWRELDDPYPLRHLPAHLDDANHEERLVSVLRDSDFLQVKVQRLKDPFLAVQDVEHLARILLRVNEDSQIVDLAASDYGYQRDGVILALRHAEPAIAPRIKKITEELLIREPGLGRSLRLWLWPRSRSTSGSSATINARKVALEVAYHLDFVDVLIQAASDRSDSVRVLVLPYLYRFWNKRREPGWRMLEQLIQRMFYVSGLPNRRVLEACAGMSLEILIYHFDDPQVLERLRTQWQTVVRRTLRLRHLLRMVLFVMTRTMRWLLATQADYQPLNLRELAVSYSAASSSRHRLGLESLKDLASPERGVAGTVNILLQKETPYDVHLMLVVERTLIFHGFKNPGDTLAALDQLHRDGCRWFRQSALYAAFHILRRAECVEGAWLDQYERMTHETIQEARATFSTGHATYPLVPHMAWAEIVFDQHRPAHAARFIPTFYQEAIQLRDYDYARRVLAACEILALVYRRIDLALDALQAAFDVPQAEVRDTLVQLLANIRFYNEQQVDQFLERHAVADLRHRAIAATPTVRSSDIFSWVDDFVIDRLTHSDGFRQEVVGAFERAGHARSLDELSQQVLKWVMSLIEGR